MQSNGDILKKFYADVVRRDLAAARGYLADDLVFVGLFATYRGADEYIAALTGLLQVRARVDHETVTIGFTRLSVLALEHRLSVYDAAYLELAQRRKLPLGCKDGPLREAAKRVGVPLWT